MRWQDKLIERFQDKIIPKRMMSNLVRRALPRFVTEYLLARYVDRGEEEAVRLVNRIIAEYYPESREAERVLYELSREGQKRLISYYTARFDTRLNIPLVTIRLWAKEDARILPKLLNDYPALLEGGVWGIADIVYDPSATVEGRKLPLLIVEFRPFQIARIDVEDFKEGREEFTTEEWLSVLMSTIGFNPHRFTREQTLYILTRFIPLVESNSNLMELGPRGTGKTFGLRNISPYSFVISGGKTTSAQLFINLRSMEVGLLARKDVVVFDEIAAAKFEKRDDVLGKLKDYMASGVFTRGREEIPSECGIMLLGNIDHGTEEDEKDELRDDDLIPGEGNIEEIDEETERIGGRHLFQALPESLWDTAFFDRLHGFIPGWRIPKIRQDFFSNSVGFVADYFAEVLHRLRRDDYTHEIKRRVEVYGEGGDVSIRDEEAIAHITSGLIKLLYPHGKFTDEELTELLNLACELRTRVTREQHYIERTLGGKTQEFPLRKICWRWRKL